MAQNGGSVAQPVPHELIKKMSEMLFTMNGLETALTTADNVSSGSVQQAAVHQSLYEYQRQLHELRMRMKASANVPDGALSNCEVPQSLLQALDAGISPDNYLKEMFLAGVRDNQLAKGKVEALELLRSQLQAQAAAHFPDAVAQYAALEAQAASATMQQ